VVVVTAVVEAVIATAVVVAAVVAVAVAMIANRAGNQVSTTCGSGWLNSVSEARPLGRAQKPQGKSSMALLRPFKLLPFCFKRLQGRDQPPATAGGSDYFLAAGVILSVNRSLPRTISTSYSCPAFISPSA